MFNLNKFSTFVKGGREEKKNLKEEVKDFNYLDESRVEEIQGDKRKVLENLKNKLKSINVNSEEEVFFSESQNLRSVGFENGQYYIYGKKGKKEEISLGEIMVASLWGKDLKLLCSVPRNIKKRFLFNEAKKKIAGLWDEQLLLSLESLPQTTYADGARSILENRELNIDELPLGFAAEKMIDSFFTKIFYDFPELPFEFEEASVYDDVYQKVDFKIRIKKEYIRSLSVDVCLENENCEELSEIGVQYTMNEDMKKKKESQIRKSKNNLEGIDDIVLVTLPIKGIKIAIEKWKKEKTKTTLTGPEMFLGNDEKKKIFLAVLENLPRSLNIKAEEYWKKIGSSI